MEQFDYQRVKAEATQLVEFATKMEFSKSLVKENLLEEEKVADFEKRQLKLIKSSLASIFAQLELENVECRMDNIFTLSKDE